MEHFNDKYPLISIIVPVFNVEQYLEKCLNSLVCQTFSNFEVIIVNDGTLDNSQTIIDRFCLNNSKQFFSYIKENGGLGTARNFGISKSKGLYLFFLDSDDWIENTTIEVLTNVVVDNPNLELCVFDFYKYIINNKKTVIKGFNGRDIQNVKERVMLTDVVAWNKLYCRSLFDKIEFAIGLHEDVSTIPIILGSVKNVVYLKKALYNYVIREGSITQSGLLSSKPDFIKALSILADRNSVNYNESITQRIDQALFKIVFLVHTNLKDCEHDQYYEEVVNYFQKHNHSFSRFIDNIFTIHFFYYVFKMLLKGKLKVSSNQF